MFPGVFTHHTLVTRLPIKEGTVPAILNDFTSPIVDFVIHFMASLQKRDGETLL